jgi:isopenicillin-N N-acyltransferase like protein
MLNRRTFLKQSLRVACSVAAVPSVVRLGAAQEDARRVAPFGEVTVISGTARERGRQYGKCFSDGIHEFLDREIYRAFAGQPATKDDLLRYAGACAKVIGAECPVIADELEGMAEGSGLRLEEHVLLTLHEELYHRGVLPPISHCTAVAVGRPGTRDGIAYVGQTWDWMPSVAGMSSVLEWRRNDGPSLLAYAFPGLWVGAGLNANGLALCWTSADLGISGQMARVGLPSYVLLAHLLYQENLDAVRETARRNTHAGWFTFVMADGDGRLMNIEGAPDGIEVEETTGRLIRVGFGTRRMSRTKADQAVARHPRCPTMDKLLDEASGQVELATLQRCFGEPSCGICVGTSTIDMMVFDTTHRTAHLSRGAAYGVAWKKYAF